MNLKDRLEDSEWVDSLSERKRKELMLCSLLLSEEELESKSSIAAGYRVARNRLLHEVLPEMDPEFYEKSLTQRKTPIFDVESLIEDWRKVKNGSLTI